MLHVFYLYKCYMIKLSEWLTKLLWICTFIKYTFILMKPLFQVRLLWSGADLFIALPKNEEQKTPVKQLSDTVREIFETFSWSSFGCHIPLSLKKAPKHDLFIVQENRQRPDFRSAWYLRIISGNFLISHVTSVQWYYSPYFSFRSYLTHVSLCRFDVSEKSEDQTI